MGRRGRACLADADGDLLGRRVSAWLAMHRVEAAELAGAVGCDRSGLSRALHGRRLFPVSLALAICDYTGLAFTGDSVAFDPARAAQRAAGEPIG